MKVFYLSFLILYFTKYSAAELQYDPPSRELVVMETDDYSFGIVEDGTTRITRCYYTTNTDVRGYFDVYKEEPTTTENVLLESNFAYQNINQSFNDEEVRAVNNEVTHRGEAGYCAMRIRWADGNGPTRWTITPYNNPIEGEKKNLSDITFTIHFFYKIPLLREKDPFSIFESEGFYQHLIATNINFRKCELYFSNTAIDLDLQSTRINSFLTPYSEIAEKTTTKISSLGKGLCGFRLKNATSAETLKWRITGTDDQGRQHRASFRSQILPKIDSSIRNIKQSVAVGEETTIRCGNSNSQQACTLYNPSGRLMFTNINRPTDCAYKILTVAMEDMGIWTCITGNEYGLQPINYTVELTTNISAKPVETWIHETDNYFNIGCRKNNKGGISLGISLCKMIAPNQQVFFLQTGGATDRYVAYGTDFKKATCAIEIPKPLLDFEKGIWRCEMSSTYGDFINLGGGTQLPHYPKHSNVTLQLEQPYEILCQVPYSSEYCHIKAPNGTIYSVRTEAEVGLGKCSLPIESINVTDNGTWTCSFAQKTGEPDEEIVVEITVAEVLQYYKNTEVDVGSTAELMCKSGGLPFKYCRFIAPNGTFYHIANHQISNTISYYGRGLEYGECGIRIANTQTSDSGYWTCIARIGSDFKQSEIRAPIMLEVTPSFLNDPNIAAAVGIAVGVVVVSSIVSVVVIRKWRRRRHTEVPGSTTAPRRLNDEDSNSETVDIFSVGPSVRSYTNPESVRDDPHEHQM